nr:SpoIIE family protein phosphatase [Planosporangium thailandense]
MRNRAVIEQAKGVLVERLGVTPDEGFDHLKRLSQRANVKLVEVAATIVGATSPDPRAAPVTEITDEQLRARAGRSRGRSDPAAGRRPNRPAARSALQAQHQLISARIAASTTFDEAAEVVGAAEAGWPPPAAVVITLREPTGAHRFVGGYGPGLPHRGGWQPVPPPLDTAIAEATRDGAPLLVTDDGRTSAAFAAPLLDGERVIGALCLSWPEPVDLDADTRRYLSALATPVASKAVELAEELPPEAGATGGPADPAAWLPIVGETVPDPVALLAPVHEDGRVVDFRVEYANAAATRRISPTRIGNNPTLLTIYPRLGSELLLPRFVELLRTGRPQRLGPVRLRSATGDGAPTTRFLSAHASLVGDRVVLAWRVHDEAELVHAQLLDAERIARIGSFRWELDRAEPYCSPQLYRMFHGDERPRPIAVDELSGCVYSDDLPAVEDAVRRTLVGGEQLSWEFRGADRLAGRRLRIVAEPELDGTGAVTAIRGTVQDVTEERAIADRLRLAEEALTAQRLRVDAELRAAQSLHRALMPSEPELGATEGLWVTGRTRSSRGGTRVDGNWYDACALPEGVSLLVVGDVAGTGLAAMTTAARLRYAIRAYAALDMSPGQLLASVNTLLCALEPERTATLMVARYEAKERRLRWAAAGQAAPVRYRRDGGAELLPGQLGLPVGVLAEATYSDATVDVAPGDRLLLYTDSLVGARGTDLVSALDVLLGAGAHAGRDDVEAVVSHVVGSLHVGADADMGAMLVRVA